MSALAVGATIRMRLWWRIVRDVSLGAVLPKDHLSRDAGDVIKVAMAMIATLAAFVLVLLIASARRLAAACGGTG